MIVAMQTGIENAYSNTRGVTQMYLIWNKELEMGIVTDVNGSLGSRFSGIYIQKSSYPKDTLALDVLGLEVLYISNLFTGNTLTCELTAGRNTGITIYEALKMCDENMLLKDDGGGNVLICSVFSEEY